MALNVRLFAKAVRLFDVRPGSFVPSPEINSTVIRLEPRVPPPSVDFNEWDALVRVVFSRRRKTLRAQFKKLSTLAMLEQNYKTLRRMMLFSIYFQKIDVLYVHELLLDCMENKALRALALRMWCSLSGTKPSRVPFPHLVSSARLRVHFIVTPYADDEM